MAHRESDGGGDERSPWAPDHRLTICCTPGPENLRAGQRQQRGRPSRGLTLSREATHLITWLDVRSALPLRGKEERDDGKADASRSPRCGAIGHRDPSDAQQVYRSQTACSAQARWTTYVTHDCRCRSGPQASRRDASRLNPGECDPVHEVRPCIAEPPPPRCNQTHLSHGSSGQDPQPMDRY